MTLFFTNSCRFKKNEEDKSVRLLSEYWHILYLPNTRDTKNNKRQEKYKFSTCHYHIQDIKDVQHKNFSMSWDYSNFSCHLVADESYKIIGNNTIT